MTMARSAIVRLQWCNLLCLVVMVLLGLPSGGARANLRGVRLPLWVREFVIRGYIYGGNLSLITVFQIFCGCVCTRAAPAKTEALYKV
jgi:hypothetical protein